MGIHVVECLSVNYVEVLVVVPVDLHEEFVPVNHVVGPGVGLLVASLQAAGVSRWWSFQCWSHRRRDSSCPLETTEPEEPPGGSLGCVFYLRCCYTDDCDGKMVCKSTGVTLKDYCWTTFTILATFHRNQIVGGSGSGGGK